MVPIEVGGDIHIEQVTTLQRPAVWNTCNDRTKARSSCGCEDGGFRPSLQVGLSTERIHATYATQGLSAIMMGNNVWWLPTGPTLQSLW